MAAPRVERQQSVVTAVAVIVGVVLRWWDLGGPALTFDETFSAAYSRLRPSALFVALEASDSHPPLDYLVRHPLVGHGAFWFRAPSALVSSVTLLLVAWWMRGRGWFGVAVVGFTSISAFQLVYAHQARMYGLGILAGTLGAIAAERWLRGDTRPRWLVVVAAAIAVGLLSQSSFALVVPFLFLVVGWSRAASAWRWRGAVLAGVVIWGAAWGRRFAGQMEEAHATWIPYTTVKGAIEAVNGFASIRPATSIIAVALVALGGVLLWRLDPAASLGGDRGDGVEADEAGQAQRSGSPQPDRLPLVWLVVGVGPIVVLCLLGMSRHLLLTRAVGFSAWIVPIAFAAVVEAVRRRSDFLAVLVVCAIGSFVVTSIVPAITYEEDSTAGRALLASEVRPGDAVVVSPEWLWPLAAWDLGTPPDTGYFTDAPRSGSSVPRPPALAGVDGYVAVIGDQPFSGRVWLMVPDSYTFDPGELIPCAEPVPPAGGDFQVHCFDVA